MAAVSEHTRPTPDAPLTWAERRDLSLYHIMRSLPVPVVSGMGAALSRILGRRAHPTEDARVAAALRHLRPELAQDPAALEAAQTRLWANVGRVYAEFCVLDKIAPQGRVTIDDPGTVTAVLADGRPVVATFVHLGNWEASGMEFIDRAPGRVAFMAAPPPRNRVRARIADLQRSRIKGKMLRFDANVWRCAVQHLTQPGAVLMAAVDELAADRVATPSFGRPPEPRSNLGKLVRIASRSGAIVLPMYSERLAGARFVTHVLPPVEIPRTPKLSPEAQAQLVARIDALYEPVVLRLIEQWFGLLLWR